jgi:hypothetical protein
MYLQVYRGEEKERNTCTHSLASSGVARGMVHRNPVQNLIGLQLDFVVYFCYEFISNTCLTERPSRLRDDVTLGGYSL